MQDSSGYQRRYLRAPYKLDVLFVDQNFVFKGKALNISEGGLLLEEVGHFPEVDNIDFLIKLPQFPLFKNFDFDKIASYNSEVLDARVVRFKAKLVRKIKIQSKVNELFSSQIGLQIQDINSFDKAKVASYVDVFSSNLIYLLVLLDTLNSDKNNLQKVRIISESLGYSPSEKISLLRIQVEHDYKSLQWL
jgi:hypothetical protein